MAAKVAMTAMAQGDPSTAEPLLTEALEIARSRGHWMLNQVLGTQSELDLMNRRLPEARASLDQARDALRKQYGDKLKGNEAWRSAVLDSTEAYYEIERHNPKAAEPLLLAALPVLEARFGKRGLFTDRALARLVILYDATGQVERSEWYRKRLAG